MNRLVAYVAGLSIAIAVATGFVACSSPFSSGSAGGTDADRTDAVAQDGPEAVDGIAEGAAEGSVDAGHDGATAVDAAHGGSCHGAFSAPTLVLAHTAQYLVDSITLSGDELDAFVTLFPAGSTTEQRNVYAMHRASVAAPFTMDTSHPLDLTNFGPTPGAFDVALSADNLTLYFSHRQDSEAGLLGVNIYESMRGDAGATFSGGIELGPAIDDPTTNQFHAHPAGPDLYFTVAPLLGGVQGQRDLYVAPLMGGARAAITELNGAMTQDANPVPSRDELEIFFSSDRAAPGTNNRVYTAQRTSAALAFSQPTLLTLSIADAGTNVTPQHLSANGCHLYVLIDQQDALVSQRAP